MRASPCLVLFHVGKEDVDVVEDYFNQGYRANEEKKEDAEYPTLSDHGQRFDLDDHDLTLEAQQHESDGIIRDSRIKLSNSSNPEPNDRPTSPTSRLVLLVQTIRKWMAGIYNIMTWTKLWRM